MDMRFLVPAMFLVAQIAINVFIFCHLGELLLANEASIFAGLCSIGVALSLASMQRLRAFQVSFGAMGLITLAINAVAVALHA